MRTLHRVIGAALIASLTAVPVILDACMFTCHGSSDEAERSEPACHHGGDDVDVRMDAPAPPCGHDHSPAPSTFAAQSSPDGKRGVAPELLAVEAPTSSIVVASAAFTRHTVPIPTHRPTSAITPLRI